MTISGIILDSGLLGTMGVIIAATVGLSLWWLVVPFTLVAVGCAMELRRT